MIHNSDATSVCRLFAYNSRQGVIDILISRSFHRHTLFSRSHTDSSSAAEQDDGIICIPIYMGYEPISFISLLFCSTLNRSSSVQLLSTFKKPASFPSTAHREYFTGAGMGVGGVNPEAIYTSCII
jgi:hypothetical protein